MKNSPYTLLIIEDFPADRELYCRALRAETAYDYRLLEAESVAEGLSLCSSIDFDAVLLDYLLPDADGLEFLTTLTVASDGNRPPVVMMTGQGSENIAVQAMKLGVHDYLVKRDLTPELLRSTVRKAILNGRGCATENHRLQQQYARQQIIEIWESMTDAYVTVDRDWRLIYANQAATQVICYLTNLAPTEFLGRSHWELFPALVGGHVEQEYRRALTDRVAVHLDVWFEPTASWFETHLYPAAEGLGIYFRDITDRKQLEMDRVAAEQERDRFFNLSIDLLAVGNCDGYLIRINPAFERLLGFTAAELMAQPYLDFVHPNDRAATLVNAQGLANGEIVVDFENRCRRKNGSYVWVSWNATPYQQSRCWYGIGRDISDRKLLETERQAAEQERDRFFNLSIDLLAVANFDGYFTRLNPAFEQILGFTNAELIAQPFLDFVHPDDLATTVAAYQQVMNGEVLVSFENRYRCQDGSYRWVLWSATPDLEQNVMYASGHDITERKQNDLARLEAENERDRFFNLSIDLLAIGSFEGYFVRLNPAFEQVLGFTRAELMAEPFINFVHPDDRAGTIAGAESLAAGVSLVTHDNRYRCKDGSYRWISWTAIPYAPTQVWYANGHDITERKQYEAALLASERKFSAIFEQSFELMGIVSLDGILLEVNQTALDSIEVGKEQIVGKQFWDTPWWHTEQLQQQLQSAIERAGRGEFSRYEVQFLHPSGVTLTTDFSLKPVLDDAGAVWTIVAEAHDITERNQTLSELESRNQELDSFVHVVSHDLKAPLRAVANLSQWIEEDLGDTLTTATQQQMSVLRSRVHRMNCTIDGLLDYARIGRTADSIEPVAVGELILETIDSLAPPPTFQLAIAKNLPTLYAKRLLLAQVFSNLIGNAIKHHDRIDGAIHIGIAERQDYYEFAIADDGPGIPPEQHDRVFRIFQAVNPQNRSDSTGIGLAIVKKIVEAEGGTIRLESQLGKGTTFYFTWPKRS
jgi:PAS domain S-box-containing protein